MAVRLSHTLSNISLPCWRGQNSVTRLTCKPDCHGTHIQQPPPSPPIGLSFQLHSAVTFSREGQTPGAALFGLSLYLDTHMRTDRHTHTHPQVHRYSRSKLSGLLRCLQRRWVKKSLWAFVLAPHEGSCHSEFSLCTELEVSTSSPMQLN